MDNKNIFIHIKGNIMIKLLDFHCDTITKCMDNNAEMYENNFQNSFFRLLEYKAPVQVFAVYTDDVFVNDSYNYTKKAIDYYYSQIKKYDKYAKKFDINKIEDKRVNCILAIEGGEAVRNIDDLYEFANMGVKILTLTWNRKNLIGCGALSGFDEGLTEFGKKAVKVMNDEGIVIDVSHLNEKGFKDVVSISEKPFIASHSNIREVYDHKRNLWCRQAKEIVNSGGIIGINIYPDFLGNNSIYSLLKHIEIILKINEKSVCLGCDLDGISAFPREIETVSDLKVLYNALAHTFGENIAEDIFYNNGINFFKKL